MSNELGMIRLSLYGEDDEVVRELTRTFIPWGMQKKAGKLGKMLKKMEKEQKRKSEESGDDYDDMDDDSDEKVFDMIAQFICAFFQDKVTVQELDDYADKDDVMNVFKQVAGYSGNLPAGPRPRKR